VRWRERGWQNQRDLIDDGCGAVVVGCLPALLVHRAISTWLGSSGVFWLEFTMLLAFSLSWAVKGEAIGFLNDKGAPTIPLGAGRCTA
jgi:hypothetical protein